MAAVVISCLLFAIYCSAVSGSFRHSRQAFFSLLSNSPIYNKFNLFQLVIKPDSLLLKEKRSETNSEDEIQATLLFIKLTVVQSMFWLSTNSSVLFERSTLNSL